MTCFEPATADEVRTIMINSSSKVFPDIFKLLPCHASTQKAIFVKRHEKLQTSFQPKLRIEYHRKSYSKSNSLTF